MRRGLLLALLAAPAAAQYTAEPQYQLTGKNYSSEAPAIQQMFYNTTSGIQHLQSEINAIVVPASGVTKIVAGTNVTISPAGGTGNVTINSSGAGTDFGPSTAALSVRLDSVAVATTTLSASTAALSVRLDSVASATTTLAGVVSALGQSTNTFNIWQGTTSIWMTAIAASTTTLSASTASLALLKLSSPTVAGAVGNSLTIGSNGLPAWASITGGGGSLAFATATLTTDGTSFAAITKMNLDSSYFSYTSSPTNQSAFLSLKAGSAGSGWTRQVFLSGSGTYTTPAGVVQLRIRMVGGGGGGGGNQSTSGTAGSTTCWNTSGSSIAAMGGSGGLLNSGANVAGGAGGTNGNTRGTGTASARFSGNPGCNGFSVTLASGGCGASSVFGGGGAEAIANAPGGAGATNTGSGGAGGNASATAGGGGGSGEYVEIVQNSPEASYGYQVGAGGSGGTGTQAGGNGAAGIIIVDEIYPPIAAVAGTLAPITDYFLSSVNGTQKTFTLSNAPALGPNGAYALQLRLDGLTLSATSDYSLSGNMITVTTAPASNSTMFQADYFVNTSTLPAAFILTSTQTVSGATTETSSFTATGNVHISSGASVDFAAGAFTTAAQSFTPAASVTGSTISFTVQGTTVACWASGGMATNNGGEQSDLGLGMDGAVKIAIAAITYTSLTNISFQNPFYREFQVVGGGASHTFWLAAWTGSGVSVTWPSITSGQFGCREVPSR